MARRSRGKARPMRSLLVLACTISSISASGLNPYTSGCLYDALPGWNKKRVCNSDDAWNASAIGICREPPIPHLETRIYAFNWESAYFEAWLLQIVLSELLDVPVTIESGDPDIWVSLYDPEAGYEFGNTSDALTTSAFQNADRYDQDCSLASKDPETYEACAHHFPEIWNVDSGWLQDGVSNQTLENPYALGMVGYDGVYVTKHTAQQEPSILSYFGMSGEQNRRKLAELFPRPFTWWDYCTKVSLTRCIVPDEVAQRPPMYEEERNQFYAEGAYIGHFQFTEENDCDLNPDTCTGHLAPYPCGWTGFAETQMYHLNIAMKGGGQDPEMPNRGYHYLQLIELIKAANATNSNLMLEWWTPTQLSEALRNTDSELISVAFPYPTQECLDNRHSLEDLCSPDEATRVGEAIAACGEAAAALTQTVTAGLYDLTQEQDEAVQSPAYDVLKRFLITEYKLGEIYQYMKAANTTPRDATCQWAAENFESYLLPQMPRSHPRSFQEANLPAWTYTGIVLGSFAAVLVMAAAARTYDQRDRRVIRFAQVEFLWILLFGGFTLAVGAIVVAVPSSDATCIVQVWLVNIGYTLILVPLIIKVSAINHLNQMSKKMMRVTLKRSKLLGATAIVSASILVFCAVWTGVDPPTQTAQYELTDTTTEGEQASDSEHQFPPTTVVNVSYYCASESQVWSFLAVAWNVVLLVCCTVLAVQTRNIRQEFRESTVLGCLIYSHFAIALLLVMTFFIADDYSKMAKLRSILYSVDTLSSILIYFVPKLFADYGIFRRSLGIRTRENTSMFVNRPSRTHDQNSIEPFSASQVSRESPYSESMIFGVPSSNASSNNSVGPRPARRLSVSFSEFLTVPEEKALDVSEEAVEDLGEHISEDRKLIEEVLSKADRPMTEETKEQLQQFLADMIQLRKENVSLKEAAKEE